VKYAPTTSARGKCPKKGESVERHFNRTHENRERKVYKKGKKSEVEGKLKKKQQKPGKRNHLKTQVVLKVSENHGSEQEKRERWHWEPSGGKGGGRRRPPPCSVQGRQLWETNEGDVHETRKEAATFPEDVDNWETCSV